MLGTDDRKIDVFVSYAHADDEVPMDAEHGWVTTLVRELQKVLRRKLGGSGARVWMDQQLAANQNVTEELLAKVARSRVLLLVMSPGYQRSAWCQRELANHVVSRPNTQSIFVIEIEPVDRADWHPALKSLNPIKFWVQDSGELAPGLLGYPKPVLLANDPYWIRITELAHLIALKLRAHDPDPNQFVALIAETTDDLDPQRESMLAALRQRGDVEVLPAFDYPRSADSDFVAAVRNDVERASIFVQLLGPFPGRRVQGSGRTFVELQAQEACRGDRPLLVMQWRSPKLKLERIADLQHREILKGEHVLSLGFEEFRRLVLHKVDELSKVRDQKAAAPFTKLPHVGLLGSTRRDPAARFSAQWSPEDPSLSVQGLKLYLHATPEDQKSADKIADDLCGLGASVILSPSPRRGQRFLDSLIAQEEALRLCDGVLFVYGKSPVTAILTAFQYALRVFGITRRDVWGAVLDLPPVDKERVPIRSPNLVTIECRQGFDLEKLRDFLRKLRSHASASDGGTPQYA